MREVTSFLTIFFEEDRVIHFQVTGMISFHHLIKNLNQVFVEHYGLQFQVTGMISFRHLIKNLNQVFVEHYGLQYLVRCALR